MELRRLGRLWPVSALTLGGGGLGQVWGPTTRAEAVATVEAAIEGGITLFDMAPSYGGGEAERVIGEAFSGRLPEGVRITTKCQLGSPPHEEVEAKLRESLAASLETMKLDRVDLFFLHSNIIPDGYVMARNADLQDRFATTRSLYREAFRPAVVTLKEEGLIGDWGITGVGLPATIIDALGDEPKPAVVQCIANLLDSAGGMRRYDEPARPREIIEAAERNGVGVLGIRAVQAGALTDRIDRELSEDHPERLDFDRAKPFRELADEMGQKPAVLAHRYALSMAGVDSVILGVKNRTELRECLDAEAAGPLDPAIIDRIDHAVGRVPV